MQARSNMDPGMPAPRMATEEEAKTAAEDLNNNSSSSKHINKRLSMADNTTSIMHNSMKITSLWQVAVLAAVTLKARCHPPN